MLSTHQILDVTFKVGPGPELVDYVCAHGGLVVVPSAPVLVDMQSRPALREAVTQADMAITDSGLMVLLWKLFTGKKLERVSGLEYLKLLLARPELRQPAAVFFVMPTAEAKARNHAWLTQQGFPTTDEDCYIAPMYGAGALRDDALLTQIRRRRPSHIVLCLGGGVQERIGFFLRNELAGLGEAQPTVTGAQGTVAGRLPDCPPFTVHRPLSAAPQPALHCIGAAIGFLTGDQVRIPMWVDYLYLGWLWRIASAPTKFAPRYWKATQLVGLRWRRRNAAAG